MTLDHLPPEPAITAARFMASLRRIHRQCGLTAGQIAVSSGLPRSTAYRFINSDNNTLPKSRDQVLAFLQACRAPAPQIKTMLHLWDHLTGNGGPDEPARPIAVSPVEMVSGLDPADERTRLVRVAEVDLLLGELVRLTHQVSHDSAPEDGLEVRVDLGGDITCTCPVCTTPVTLGPADCAAIEAAAAAPALWWRRRATWQLHILVIVLLMLAVYPVTRQAAFGYDVFAVIPLLVVGVGLLLLLSSSLKQTGAQVVTAPRLAAVTAASLGAGGLSWLAAGTALMGLLSGFSVFALAPIWLSLTQLPGLCTTVRGLFTLISAGWFGAVLGCIAAAAAIPPAGAALTGIAGTAASIMLLSSRLLPVPVSKSEPLRSKADT
ncbi:hypothetical protein ACFXHA_43430 [Nocardia sp. NPDC059240]|uniref:hypothetical protein n=1 Tax=Nocardia sp. NPDC059240 TaxID=3346786 RepID=UPI003699D362